MIIILKIYFFLSLFKIIIAEESCGFCPLKPQFYYELDCTPIKVNGQRCPTRYSCPNFGAFNSSQCYYMGDYYNIGEQIPDELSPACKTGCYCDMPKKSKSSNSIVYAKFVCKKRHDCFTPPVRNCIYQKGIDQCCGGKQLCGQQMNQLPTCTFEQKTFRHGEIIYPHYPPCYKCACDKHFKNTTVEINRNCRRVNCNIAFENFDKVQAGCAPIYYGDEKCCPVKYRCPTEKDYVIPGPLHGTKQKCEKYSKCKFGELRLKIGDSLNKINPCLTCSCIMPPFVMCHQDRLCSKKLRKLH